MTVCQCVWGGREVECECQGEDEMNMNVLEWGERSVGV